MRPPLLPSCPLASRNCPPPMLRPRVVTALPNPAASHPPLSTLRQWCQRRVVVPRGRHLGVRQIVEQVLRPNPQRDRESRLVTRTDEWTDRRPTDCKVSIIFLPEVNTFWKDTFGPMQLTSAPPAALDHNTLLRTNTLC